MRGVELRDFVIKENINSNIYPKSRFLFWKSLKHLKRIRNDDETINKREKIFRAEATKHCI